ncbi:glycosyltransferase family 2 protein [Acetobacter senegalensis]|uniref:glycosyltransferase family 2 protein n=1 Tax=Acetobacter senegalensis TaxID=446692 RepID=UPI00128B13DA|nr:glycosyltransferase family 2 protein [Acetobacter senegalensis]MCG4256095.1 glycosyltransferase family 2 protein [Acetobacter senegalensis]MCG4266347.1 glycosyltransferase family 2 protein [Acetobacter senegalensis]MPQ75032.1 glycosyltransferase [Acetobacter senegalensis]
MPDLSRFSVLPSSTEVSPNVAVLLPCYNEEVTIAQVVREFKDALPNATIYVYDNNSQDQTMALAKEAGAVVRTEVRQGKGHVIRRMFADIDADFYVLVDGDATYEAAAAPRMLALARENCLDMVTGLRITERQAAYRFGHVLGNKVLTNLVRALFGQGNKDMLSGYRIFSKRFVKSFPALSAGFETETEFTVHALKLCMPVGEVETVYVERPEGSVSKLNTYRDGVRILGTIINLLRRERPFLFFSVISFIFCFAGILLGLPVVLEFMSSGYVPRLPTALLATGMEILAALAFCCGQILDSVALDRLENRRLSYLSYPSPPIAEEKARE